jgi:hypothetical protein
VPAFELQQPQQPQRAEFEFPAPAAAAVEASPRVGPADAGPLAELPRPPLDVDVPPPTQRPVTPHPAAPELAPAPPPPDKPSTASKPPPARPALAPLHTAPSTVPSVGHPSAQTNRAATLTLLPAPQLPPLQAPQHRQLQDDDAGSAPPPLPSEGELYKARIEALRQDFGSSWLSALAADDGWDAAAVATAAAAAASSTPFDAVVVGHHGPAGVVRAAGAGVVGVGARSLG